MVTLQSQIKVNLPLALKEYLESKAQKFGMPLASYVKHLILKDVENMEYPVFEMSKKSEKSLSDALRNKNKAAVINNKGELDKFFKNLWSLLNLAQT